VDGLCANESQVALSQLTPQRQNPALQADFGLPKSEKGRFAGRVMGIGIDA
jgi:hypothetical protein